jgi:hypothetical protein
MENRRSHWNNLYATKTANEVSWTQATPQTSLGFIRGFGLAKEAPIIDIGGGESRLAEYLLAQGFTNITVLDIAEQALEKAKMRLGKKASMVKWIVSDITEFEPPQHYDLWHDRATFHFLTTPEQIETYLKIAGDNIDCYLVVGTFSDKGPEKCSGLPVKQYSEAALQQTLARDFKKIECVTEDHITPFKTVQNFTFCSFQKR